MNAFIVNTINWEKSWMTLLISRRITTHKNSDPVPSSQLQAFFTSWINKDTPTITQCSLLNTETSNTSLQLRIIQPSNLLDGRSFYRWLQEGASWMGMMNFITFIEISSIRDKNWRWFPSSLGHPLPNSERQVAQEKLLEDSMSKQLTNYPEILSILTHRTY